MTSLNAFLFWLLTITGINPSGFDMSHDAEVAPPPCAGASAAEEEEQEEPDWVEIQLRLNRNGKNGIFNGV